MLSKNKMFAKIIFFILITNCSASEKEIKGQNDKITLAEFKSLAMNISDKIIKLNNTEKAATTLYEQFPKINAEILELEKLCKSSGLTNMYIDFCKCFVVKKFLKDYRNFTEKTDQ